MKRSVDLRMRKFEELSGQYAYFFSVFTEVIELHDTVDQGKQRKVSSQSHVSAGMDLRSSLSDENVAGSHDFASEFFNA